MRRFLVVCALVAAITVPAEASAPPLIRPQPPLIGAEAWILYDVTADVELGARNETSRRAMASVTKLMTAMVVRERTELSDVVVISESAAATGEAEIDLVAGERWTVEELLTAIMVRSANDAATALAEHVGGSMAGFAELMNAAADELGLTDTAFVNPHGLDAEGHYSSAADLLVIATAAMDDPVIAELARTRLVVFRDDPGGVARRAANTNLLLGSYPGVVGLKTGFTSRAGRVLITVADIGPRRLVAVVMGAEDHFADTRDLLEFGAATYGFADRVVSGVLEEQGGGGVIVPVRFEASLRERLAAMPPLDSGQSALSGLGDTTLGAAVEQWLGDRIPAVLGGRG